MIFLRKNSVLSAETPQYGAKIAQKSLFLLKADKKLISLKKITLKIGQFDFKLSKRKLAWPERGLFELLFSYFVVRSAATHSKMSIN